jgi:hypothetical protein
MKKITTTENKKCSAEEATLIILNRVMKLLATVAILSGCARDQSTPANELPNNKTELTARVIYGADGRLDLYQVSDERLLRLAKSTVALIKNEDLSVSGNEVIVHGKNYGLGRNLCASEKFREQDAAAFCSGFLVRSDIIITAGHCIENMTDCNGTSFVFGYGLFQPGALPTRISSQNVYRCHEIIKTQRPSNGADYAVIRLNRNVTGVTPLEMRSVPTQGSIQAGEELIVIGHPVGLPTKITTGGKVRSIANSEFIVGSVDTYGGNSGSAVFNARTGLVEGILVRGEADFTSQGSCTVSKVCTEESCRGEDITRISIVQPFIPTGSDDPTNPPPISQPESFRLTANKSIPDNNQQGILSSLSVGSGSGGRKISIFVNIKHPYIGDLFVQVIAPDGKVATLHQRAGGSADNINKSYEITSSLGSTSAGQFRLIVKDLASRDLGQLVSWGVDFQ